VVQCLCATWHISVGLLRQRYATTAPEISFNLMVSLIVFCIAVCTIIYLLLFYTGADCLKVGVNTSAKELES
jgi:hypothetical protein